MKGSQSFKPHTKYLIYKWRRLINWHKDL